MIQQSPSFLAPLSLEDFFAHYWEKKPLHISRDGGAITGLIDLPAIETLLSTQPVYFPGVQLTQSGRTIDVGSYVDDQNVILPLRLFECHAQGATIVLSQAQKLFASLNDLCREATRSLKMECQANVYVSQPAKQGFNAHYDTHDVFILQVKGAKTFNFYPSPVELPCPDEKFDASKLDTLPIDESIRLTAGDTLYIPRGIVHDAIATQTDPSIHITLGVYPILMRDVVLQAVQQQSAKSRGFRQSVNPFIASESARLALQQTLEELLEQTKVTLNDTATLSDILLGFQEALSLDAAQDCRGITSTKRAIEGDTLQALPPFERVLLRQNMIIDYQSRLPRVTIYTFGQVIEFNEPYGQFVEKLLSQGQLVHSELEPLSRNQREALVGRLLQENIAELE